MPIEKIPYFRKLKPIYTNIMNRILRLTMFFALIFGAEKATACSVAGTVTSNRDSVCYQDTITLTTTGYTGTVFQWQSDNGGGWVNEAGAGATTDTYTFVPGETRQYRIIVTATGCPADTSNILTVTVGSIPVPTGTGASRCRHSAHSAARPAADCETRRRRADRPAHLRRAPGLRLRRHS